MPWHSYRPAVLSRRWPGRAFLLPLFLVSVALNGGFLDRSHALTVTPSSVTFDARLDEPVLLTLDVKPDLPATKPAVDIEGFEGDRKITPLSGGRYRVEIAPDTMHAGQINGNVVVTGSGSAESAAIPVSGTVRPWIAVQPARLFLGPIGKGPRFAKPETHSIVLVSDNKPFDIVSVDFGDIPLGTWKADPKAGVPALKRTVKLSFSADELADGIPYGALVKKAIIIHTSHSKASDLIIPVLGIIDINTTGRDYSQYLYDGHLRWEGPWNTPNFAAAFLGTGLVLLCGAGGAMHRMLSRWTPAQIAVAIILFPVIVIGCHFLGLTYSRGGWLGMAVSAGILLRERSNARFYAAGLAALFVLCVAIQPRGASRVASTAEISGDKSVGHRLLVWQGALQMMAEHPWSGVGAGKFGSIFSADYQLPTHTDEYTTAVNDYLTLGAERGIPLLALAITATWGIAIAALRAGASARSSTLLGCGTGMICYLVCCWFSSVAFYWNPSGLFVVAGSGALLALLVREIRLGRDRLRQRIVRRGIAALLIFAVLSAAFWISGMAALRTRPVVRLLDLAGISGIEVSPRWSKAKGTIFYIGDKGETPESLVKSTLRPLAAKGWNVLCFQQPRFESDALESLAHVIDAARRAALLEKDWRLAGHRRGSQLAIALAARCRPATIACYLPPSQSAFHELSPVLLVKRAGIPLLLCAQDADPLRSTQHLSELVASDRDTSGAAIARDIQHGAFTTTSPKWQLWIDAVDRFEDGSNIKSGGLQRTNHAIGYTIVTPFGLHRCD